MLYIYTKKPNNYFSKEFLKELGRFLFKKSRGPMAVNESLIRGLNELGIEYSLNDKQPKLDGSEIFFINSSLDALKWATDLKKKGKIKKLVAGPNLVVMPSDFNGIILSKEIDIIILPSDWVKRFWLASGFNLIEKIRIWPAGVKDDGIKDNEKKKVLFYKKNISNEVYLMVKNLLKKLNINFEEIIYGKFSRNNYLKKLDKSSFLIYLQESESQGLSLLEAWMKNVSTFVFNRNYFKKNEIKIYGKDIAAPYLHESCGAFFENEEILQKLISDLFSGISKYSPRNYYLSEFTDKICAKKLMKIIYEEKYENIN